MKPTLMILAAGMGSRYGGLKQLDGVGPNDETIIDYSIYDAIKAGFGKVVFIIRKSFEDEFGRIYSEKLKGRVPALFVNQELDLLPEGFTVPADREKPWGTAHAMLVARKLINEPFAVINADDYYGQESFKLLHDYLAGYDNRPANEHCLVGYKLSNTLSEHGTVSRGVCEVDDDGFLATIAERKGVERHEDHVRHVHEDGHGRLEGHEVVSMNMWGFHHGIYDTIERVFTEFLKEKINEPKSECYIPDFVDDIIQSGKGKVKVLNSPDSWFGVTYQQDRPVVVEKLAQLIKQGVYPERLWI